MIRDVRVVTAGKYSVWFKTPIGEGAGVVEFEQNGELHGGDSTFIYEGSWRQVNGRFQAALSAIRNEAGPPGVFGLDELNITLTGLSYDGGTSVSCTGFAKQSPGLPLELTLLRIRDDQ